MFELNQAHQYPISEVENMYPFEQAIFVGLAKQKLKEKLEE